MGLQIEALQMTKEHALIAGGSDSALGGRRASFLSCAPPVTF